MPLPAASAPFLTQTMSDLTPAELDVLRYYLGLVLASAGGRDQLDELLNRHGYALVAKSNRPEPLDKDEPTE